MPGGKMLRDQTWVDLQSPMPTDDASMSSSVKPITGETVSLFYNSSGTRTTDAGQLAGVVVQGRFANKNILTVSGGNIGTFKDSSISFTGDCFTDEVAFDTATWEKNKDATWVNKLAALTANLSEGQFMINYRTSEFWGKKATATASLTATSYSINLAQSGTSGGLDTDVNIDQVGGVEISAKNAVFAEPPLGVGMEFEALGSLATDGGTAGDKVSWKASAVGVPYVTLADAAGVADIGSSMNTLLGTIDADTGAIKIAVELLDDTVYVDGGDFTLTSTKVIAGGRYAEDPTNLTAVTTGKIGVAKQDLLGRDIVTQGTGSDVTNDSIGAASIASIKAVGMDTFVDEDVDNTAQAAATGAANLYKAHVINGGATLNGVASYIQLYDIATGSVTVGTTQSKYTIIVPASGGTIEDFDTPMKFATALTYTATTTPSGNTDPTNGLTLSLGLKE